MIKSRMLHPWGLLILTSLLVALSAPSCREATVSPSIATRVATAAPPVMMPVPLGLSPNKTVLNPGEQVVISVVSEQWRAADITWELYSDTKDSGTLSVFTGPVVIYTAPQGSGKVSVSVKGRAKDAIGSATVTFTIQRTSQGVIEFWTFPPASDWDLGQVSEFAKIHPDVLVKTVSLPAQDARTKLLAAITAGAAPDVVRFLQTDDVQAFGKNRLLDADGATSIIRGIGEEKFNPKLLQVLRDPVEDKRWLAVPSERGALGIIMGAENKSVVEVWVRFLVERELKP